MLKNRKDISYNKDIILDAVQILGEEYSEGKVKHVFYAYIEYIHWKVKQKGVISFNLQGLGHLYIKTKFLRDELNKIMMKVRTSERYNVINLIQKYHRLNTKMVYMEMLKDTMTEPGHYQFRLNDRPRIVDATQKSMGKTLMDLEIDQNTI